MKKSKPVHKREMPIAEVKEFIKSLLDDYGDVFHEWNTRKAERFFKASGISKRNWRVYMRHAGLADGASWTLRAIADDEGNISLESQKGRMQTVNQEEVVLSQEQETALAALESGQNVFLTGEAGTGKSTVLRAFRRTASHP